MPKNKLNTKAALHEGRLISSVTIDGQIVTLTLKIPFNEKSLYLSINAALYNLYNRSTAFQQNFVQPITGNSRPALTLKPGVNYESQDALISALQSFAAPTASLNVKRALGDGRLISSVTIDGQSVTLALTPPFNEESQYPSINVALYKLYIKSTAFKQSFEHPQTGYSRPALRLKPGIHYESQDALINALQGFASPEASLNVKNALNAGTLISSVTIDGKIVTLELKAPFNEKSLYPSINAALYHLYKTSTEFQQNFERPKYGSAPPTLKLMPGVDYESQNTLLNALQKFASSKRNLSLRSALSAGILIASATIDGQRVRLELKAPFNHASKYDSVNKALYNLYNKSEAFQKMFERPKYGSTPPTLTLKPGKYYESQDALINALREFGTSGAPRTSATPGVALNVKSALSAGRLISSVTIDGQSITLELKTPFNDESHYKAINRELFKLYNKSKAFQQDFERPQSWNSHPVLILRPGIDYESQDALINALRKFAGDKFRNIVSSTSDSMEDDHIDNPFDSADFGEDNIFVDEQDPSTNNNATPYDPVVPNQQNLSVNNNATLKNLAPLEDILEAPPPVQHAQYDAIFYETVDLDDIFTDGQTALRFAQMQDNLGVTEEEVDALFKSSTHDQTRRPT